MKKHTSTLANLYTSVEERIDRIKLKIAELTEWLENNECGLEWGQKWQQRSSYQKELSALEKQENKHSKL